MNEETPTVAAYFNIPADQQKFNRSGLTTGACFGADMNECGGRVCSVGGRIDGRGFRLDVMVRSRKSERNSSQPPPAVSTVNICKWKKDGGVWV